MAPEQARGEARVTPLWDIYALGAILHYILTGRVPGPDATARAGRGEAAPLAPARAFDRTIPRELDAICARALARAAEDRYPSAKALAEDVQAFLEQRPVSAFPEGVARRAWKWARRRRRPLAGAVAALLVVAGAAFTSRVLAARAALDRARADADAAGSAFRAARQELGGAPQIPAPSGPPASAR